ncbi:DUF3251 domain-containing protein [Escherichia coli]
MKSLSKQAECKIQQWGLPSARSQTPARLESQIGTLRMSLGGLRLMHTAPPAAPRIQGESNHPLPHSAELLRWANQGTIDNFQEINVQNQLINAPASVLAPSDVDIPLQLKGISVEQLDFVRNHHIQPVMQ